MSGVWVCAWLTAASRRVLQRSIAARLGMERLSPARAATPAPVHHPTQQAGSRNLLGPVSQNIPAQRCDSHPLGEPLTIHFTPQNAQLDKPDEQRFGFSCSQPLRGVHTPVGSVGQLLAALGALVQEPVEAAPERQAAHGLAGPPLGVLGEFAGVLGDHANAADAVILGVCSIL